MSDPIEQAWRVHSAQVDWTGKVDAKASFAFGIESAAMGATIALSAGGRTFAKIDGSFASFLYWLGLAGLLVGAGCSLLAVVPRLRGAADTAREAKQNFIYFGHLRHWSAEDLAATLSNGEMLDVISRQCVNMAKIAWRKHRLVQFSMVAGALGIGALVLCGLTVTS